MSNGASKTSLLEVVGLFAIHFFFVLGEIPFKVAQKGNQANS